MRFSKLQIIRSIKELLCNLATLVQVKLRIKPTICFTSWAALKEWVYTLKKGKSNPQNGKSIIVVAIRNTTWIEWAIYAAFRLHKIGYKVVVFYSKSDINRAYHYQGWLKKRYFNFWESSMKNSFLTFVDFDLQENGALTNKTRYHEIAADFANTIVAYDLRVEEFEQDILVNQYVEDYKKAYEMLIMNCHALEEKLKPYNNTRIVCPSGLIEKSVVFFAISQLLKLDIMFIEAWGRRRGHMIWRYHYPAMFYDIEGWANVVGKWDEIKEKDFETMTNFQNLHDVSDNEWFNGFVPVQRTKIDTHLPFSFTDFISKPGTTFLLGTNVVGDSATLRRATIFRNQKEWFREVIKFFSGHPDLKLVIRIHPDEIFPRARVKLGELISDSVKHFPNIYLFKAEDDVNTNALMVKADVGLAWVSNFGVDMILHRKPALIAGRSNYMQLGIGLYAKSSEEYFRILYNLATNYEKPDDSMIERAKIYQRIVFKEMSLGGSSKSYEAKDYRLSDDFFSIEQDKFFKVLCGDLDEFGKEKA